LPIQEKPESQVGKYLGEAQASTKARRTLQSYEEKNWGPRLSFP